MPRLVNSFARTDLVIAALNEVLASDGIPGLTMRRIAAAAHLSPAALTDHYGNRARLLRVIAHWTGLAGALRHEVAGRDLDTVRALIDGLLVAVCAPTRPMPRETAREILAGWVARFGA